jgi:hypothetical protein
MIEKTHPTATGRHRASQATDDPLVISGPGPFTVYTKVDNEGVAEFSDSETGTAYTSISWTHDKTVVTAASITFTFIGTNPISKLTSSTTGLSFQGASHGQQVGSCSASVGSYHFTVTYTSKSGVHEEVDPVIVVSIPPADGGT